MSGKKRNKGRRIQKEKKSDTKRTSVNFSLALLVGLFGMVLYLNTLGHQWALDDYSVIKENFVTKRGLSALPTIFSTSYRNGYWNNTGTLYRPMSLATFALEWQLAGDSPFLGHFNNVWLYGLTGFVLFLLLRRWLGRKHILIPLAIAMIYMAHPIHTEVVANIKSRDELLAGLFALLSLYYLWSYHQTEKKNWMLVALLCFGIALFSKESAITLLAVFPLSFYCFAGRTAKDALLATSWFFLPTLIFLAARYAVIGGVTISNISVLDNTIVGAESYGQQLASTILFLGYYLKTLLFPHPLVHELGYAQVPIAEWLDWRVILSALAYTGMVVYALLNLNKDKLLAFGILFFLATFSVGTNLFVQIGTSYAERLLYLPSLGFALVVGVLLFRLFNFDPPSRMSFVQAFREFPVPLVLLGLLLVSYSYATIDRNGAWYDSYSLYVEDLQQVPNSAKLNYHYGLALVGKYREALSPVDKQRWLEEADGVFERAIEIYPSYADAYAELGLSAFRQNNFDRALAYFDRSLSLKPNNAKVLSNKAVILVQQNRLEEAKSLYERAIQLDPRYVDALRNLGVVYAQTQHFSEAIRYFSQALLYAPDDAVLHLYMGQAYRDSGNPDKAQPYLDRAYQLDPGLRR